MAGQNGPISIPTVVEHVEEVCNTENVDALHLGKYQYLYCTTEGFLPLIKNDERQLKLKQRLHSA